MQTQDTMMVPYGKLRISPRNVRDEGKLPKVDDGILELADSIEAQGGLLNNLVVTEHGKGQRQHCEVEAGGRRLSALSVLFERGKITKSTLIPCKRVSIARAVAASLAENIHRAALHPADEYAAFKRLVDDGSSIEEVATAFRITPRVVERRLKLANVAPRFLAMYKADDIRIDEVMALAITDDHERQSQVWDALPVHSRNARDLREALTEAEIDIKHDPVARYVGISAYTKAGGASRRDIFSDTEDAYLLDAALLHTLAQKKLDAKVAAISKEGFAWVEGRLRLDFVDRQAFGRIGTVRREPTTKEAKAIEEVKETMAPLEEKLEASELSDEEFDELDELGRRLNELQEALDVPDPQQQAIAGAIVTIGRDGKVEILRDLIRPEDKKRMVRERVAKASEVADGSEVVGDSAASPYSEKLTRNLTSHVTAALQLGLARHPHAALAALTHTLLRQVFDDERPDDSWSTQSVVKITHHSVAVDRHAPNIVGSPLQQELDKIKESWRARLPATNWLDWLLSLPQEDVLQLLAFCVATSLDSITHKLPSTEAKTLAHAVSLDMADWWQPTGDSFWSHVPKAVAVRAVTEAVSAEAAAPLEKGKKGEAVRVAETLLASTRWLPPMLRL